MATLKEKSLRSTLPKSANKIEKFVQNPNVSEFDKHRARDRYRSMTGKELVLQSQTRKRRKLNGADVVVVTGLKTQDEINKFMDESENDENTDTEFESQNQNENQQHQQAKANMWNPYNNYGNDHIYNKEINGKSQNQENDTQQQQNNDEKAKTTNTRAINQSPNTATRRRRRKRNKNKKNTQKPHKTQQTNKNNTNIKNNSSMQNDTQHTRIVTIDRSNNNNPSDTNDNKNTNNPSDTNDINNNQQSQTVTMMTINDQRFQDMQANMYQQNEILIKMLDRESTKKNKDKKDTSYQYSMNKEIHKDIAHENLRFDGKYHGTETPLQTLKYFVKMENHRDIVKASQTVEKETTLERHLAIKFKNALKDEATTMYEKEHANSVLTYTQFMDWFKITYLQDRKLRETLYYKLECVNRLRTDDTDKLITMYDKYDVDKKLFDKTEGLAVTTDIRAYEITERGHCENLYNMLPKQWQTEMKQRNAFQIPNKLAEMKKAIKMIYTVLKTEENRKERLRRKQILSKATIKTTNTDTNRDMEYKDDITKTGGDDRDINYMDNNRGGYHGAYRSRYRSGFRGRGRGGRNRRNSRGGYNNNGYRNNNWSNKSNYDNNNNRRQYGGYNRGDSRGNRRQRRSVYQNYGTRGKGLNKENSFFVGKCNFKEENTGKVCGMFGHRRANHIFINENRRNWLNDFAQREKYFTLVDGRWRRNPDAPDFTLMHIENTEKKQTADMSQQMQTTNYANNANNQKQTEQTVVNLLTRHKVIPAANMLMTMDVNNMNDGTRTILLNQIQQDIKARTSQTHSSQPNMEPKGSMRNINQ